jgi:hypothetical protein
MICGVPVVNFICCNCASVLARSGSHGRGTMSSTVFSALPGSRNCVITGAFSAVATIRTGRWSRVAPVSARFIAA